MKMMGLGMELWGTPDVWLASTSGLKGGTGWFLLNQIVKTLKYTWLSVSILQKFIISTWLSSITRTSVMSGDLDISRFHGQFFFIYNVIQQHLLWPDIFIIADISYNTFTCTHSCLDKWKKKKINWHVFVVIFQGFVCNCQVNVSNRAVYITRRKMYPTWSL